MQKNHFYIDFENTSNACFTAIKDTVKGLDKESKNVINIFFNSTTKIDIASIPEHTDTRFHKLKKAGKNSMDFQIITQLILDISSHQKKTREQLLFIVSNDNGYDVAIETINEQMPDNITVKRIQTNNMIELNPVIARCEDFDYIKFDKFIKNCTSQENYKKYGQQILASIKNAIINNEDNNEFHKKLKCFLGSKEIKLANAVFNEFTKHKNKYTPE